MNEKVTASQLKNWLEGVLEFMPDGWVPDSGQWEKILNKIRNLEDAPEHVHISPAPNPAPNPVPSAPVEHAQPASAPRNPRASGPQAPPASVIDTGDGVKLPDAQQKRQKHVQVQQASSPQVIDNGGTRVIDTGKIHKLGVIDSSDGNYHTDFI